jgi:hypothetical protein
MATALTDPTQIELGHLANIVFTPDLKEKLKAIGIDTTRAIYELSSPTTQCSVITGIRDPNGNPCYICGMPINDTKIKGRPQYPGLTSECEHLLPIAQSIIFLGLYWAKAKTGGLFVPTKDVLRLEYEWAHRTCNQVKSDRSFIIFNKKSEIYETNSDAIEILLRDIFSNKRSNSSAFNTELHRIFGTGVVGLSNFIRARKDTVISRFQIICDYLNGFNAPQLLTLIGAAQVMEGQLAPEAKILLNTNNTEKYNTTGIKSLTNAAFFIDSFDNLKAQTVALLPPLLQREYSEFILNQGDENPIPYANFIKNLPDDLKQFAIPYLKIIFLRKLSKHLQEIGKRQYTTVSKTADFLTKTSNISESTFEELNMYASHYGVTIGGKRYKKKSRKRIIKKYRNTQKLR